MLKKTSRVVENKSGNVVTRWRVVTVKLCGFTVYQSQTLLEERDEKPSQSTAS